MKDKLFISYSTNDIDKVKLIEGELKNHRTLEALVIAQNSEAGKLLTQKVIEGINSANIIIPIITGNSIREQWLNQEIGYASALNKKIVPIIQKDLINSLKGFIHKQLDLPYTYSKPDYPTLNVILGEDKKTEEDNFRKCFRTLIQDIEKNKETIFSQGNVQNIGFAPIIDISSGLQKAQLKYWSLWQSTIRIKNKNEIFSAPQIYQKMEEFFNLPICKLFFPTLNSFFKADISSEVINYWEKPNKWNGISNHFRESKLEITNNTIRFEFAQYFSDRLIFTNLFSEMGSLIILILFCNKLNDFTPITLDVNISLRTNAHLAFDNNPNIVRIYKIDSVMDTFYYKSDSLTISRQITGIKNKDLISLLEAGLHSFICDNPGKITNSSSFLRINNKKQNDFLDTLKKESGSNRSLIFV